MAPPNHDYAIGCFLNYITTNNVSQHTTETEQKQVLRDLIANNTLEYYQDIYEGPQKYTEHKLYEILDKAVQRKMKSKQPEVVKSIARPYVRALFARGTGMLEQEYVGSVTSAPVPAAPILPATVAVVSPKRGRGTKRVPKQDRSTAAPSRPAAKPSAVRKPTAKHTKRSSPDDEEDEREEVMSDSEAEARPRKRTKPAPNDGKKHRLGDDLGGKRFSKHDSQSKSPRATNVNPKKTKATKIGPKYDSNACEKQKKRPYSEDPDDGGLSEQGRPNKKAKRDRNKHKAQNDPRQLAPSQTSTDDEESQSENVSVDLPKERRVGKKKTKGAGGVEGGSNLEDAELPQAPGGPKAPGSNNDPKATTNTTRPAEVPQEDAKGIPTDAGQTADGASGAPQPVGDHGNPDGQDPNAGKGKANLDDNKMPRVPSPRDRPEAPQSDATEQAAPMSDDDFNNLLDPLRDMISVAVAELVEDLGLRASDTSQILQEPPKVLLQVYEHVLTGQHNWLITVGILSSKRVFPTDELLCSLIASFLLNKILEKELPWESPMVVAGAHHPLACLREMLSEQNDDIQTLLWRASQRQLSSKLFQETVVSSKAQQLAAELCLTLMEHVVNLFFGKPPANDWYGPFRRAMVDVCRKTLEVKALWLASSAEGQWTWLQPEAVVADGLDQGRAVALSTFPGFQGHTTTGEGEQQRVVVEGRFVSYEP